jgi:hypothetical protein
MTSLVSTQSAALSVLDLLRSNDPVRVIGRHPQDAATLGTLGRDPRQRKTEHGDQSSQPRNRAYAPGGGIPTRKAALCWWNGYLRERAHLEHFRDGIPAPSAQEMADELPPSIDDGTHQHALTIIKLANSDWVAKYGDAGIAELEKGQGDSIAEALAILYVKLREAGMTKTYSVNGHRVRQAGAGSDRCAQRPLDSPCEGEARPPGAAESWGFRAQTGPHTGEPPACTMRA